MESPRTQWRNNTEWSLPHEPGHQLGLTDLYVLDYHWHENHRMLGIADLLIAYLRGQRERYTITLRTSYGSPDSPPSPRNLRLEKIDVIIDLRQHYHKDLYWFSNANCFAVSTIGTGGLESELVETVLK